MSRGGVLVVFFSMAAAISSVPTAHASELIAYFNSPQLPGTSTIFPGAYELLSASLSLSSNVVIGQGISSVVQPGKVFAKAFQINRASDISSIAIDTLAFQGTTLPSVLISQTILGVPLFNVTLTDVIISGTAFSASSSGDIITESISLSYNEYEVTYFTYANGQPTPQSYDFNLATLKGQTGA
ncbi:hypothetical protein WJX75_009785 [Coccomyxa subellipsoidea]|uniref:Choice-of-anchor E domain-containing protein n=1 Tax=Coccomyxa subellipsoidea TaxID=248742 RepID=A0ABR2Z5D5_9CHLO